MRKLLLILFMISMASVGWAQKIIEDKYGTEGLQGVSLNFPYADEVKVKTSSTNEIVVYVSAQLDEDASNKAYSLEVEDSDGILLIGTDKEKLEAYWKAQNRKCFNPGIFAEISIPAHLSIDFNSISGSITTDLFNGQMNLKTISGDIDISFPGDSGAEINASTISGAMYSDLDLEFLDNKSGLDQIVGQKVHANVNNGGPRFDMETISGNIYLRRKL